MELESMIDMDFLQKIDPNFMIMEWLFFFFLTIKNICSRSLFFVWKMSDIYFREIIKKMSLMEKLNFLVSKKNQLDGFLEFGYKINKNP